MTFIFRTSKNGKKGTIIWDGGSDARASPRALSQNVSSTWYVLILKALCETRAIEALIARLCVWDEWGPCLSLKGK